MLYIPSLLPSLPPFSLSVKIDWGNTPACVAPAIVVRALLRRSRAGRRAALARQNSQQVAFKVRARGLEGRRDVAVSFFFRFYRSVLAAPPVKLCQIAEYSRLIRAIQTRARPRFPVRPFPVLFLKFVINSFGGTTRPGSSCIRDRPGGLPAVLTASNY